MLITNTVEWEFVLDTCFFVWFCCLRSLEDQSETSTFLVIIENECFYVSILLVKPFFKK
jgi:hypothetical protein